MDMFNKLKVSIAFCALLSLSGLGRADQIQDANKLFKQGKNTQALEKVNSFLSDKPKDPQARFLKGLIFNAQGNLTEAITIFTALTDDYPKLPEPFNNLAVFYADQGQYDKAMIALEMAIRTHPSYATAHENLGDIYANMASQAYDRALQLDKNNSAARTKLALIRPLFGKRSSKTVPPTTATENRPAVTAIASTTTTDNSTPASAYTKGELLQATKAWAATWSAQNTDKYLSYYASNFKTPNGEGRAAWEAMRKDRISKPKSIKVGVSEAKVSMIDAAHASVSFKQSYRATHLTSSSNKVLIWVKSGNNWQITEEKSSN